MTASLSYHNISVEALKAVRKGMSVEEAILILTTASRVLIILELLSYKLFKL